MLQFTYCTLVEVHSCVLPLLDNSHNNLTESHKILKCILSTFNMLQTMSLS